MKKESIWLNEKNPIKCDSLKEDLNVDVLIIGGGITGIQSAYQLRNSNLKICVVDASLIGQGLTSRTTGKLTYLQGIVYSKLTNDYSLNTANMYLKSQQDAIKEVEKIIKNEKINCDFQKVKSCLYASEEQKIKELKQEKNILKTLGINVLETESKNFYSIEVFDTAVFHPLKYVYSLEKVCLDNQIKIFENTKIIQINHLKNKYCCLTEKNKIMAKYVVLACHYPFFLLPYFLPIKTKIEQSYLMAFETKQKEKLAFLSIDKDSKSFRFWQNKKIFLANSHLIGNHLNRRQEYTDLIENFVNLKPEYIWSNDDLITNDKMPFIGQIKKKEPNLLLATGYNTWGMTNSTIASIIIKDLILNNYNEYAFLFNPLRHKPLKLIGNYFINAWENSESFIVNKLNYNKKWYPSNISFTTINGQKIAIYTDENNVKHQIINKCPHMGCSLIFNEVEKIWECPCHASKFDIDGNCLKGPSKKKISFENKK